VQRPRLAFQHAKLAFEAELARSGLDWTVLRPTALMKSLSGQVARVRRGRPFVVFGDGRLTATRPISDDDLGDFLAARLTDASSHGRVLPIGGPGPALAPLDQADILAGLLGRRVRVRRVPPALLSSAARALSLVPALAERAELARIGHYYATESMLVLDPATGRYDADATPETGRTTWRDHAAALLDGADADLREHAVFDAPPRVPGRRKARLRRFLFSGTRPPRSP
jgi:divinyl chlorophyllide a 8-vinyl-reductase